MSMKTATQQTAEVTQPEASWAVVEQLRSAKSKDHEPEKQDIIYKCQNEHDALLLSCAKTYLRAAYIADQYTLHYLIDEAFSLDKFKNKSNQELRNYLKKFEGKFDVDTEKYFYEVKPLAEKKDVLSSENVAKMIQEMKPIPSGKYAH